MKYPGSKTLNPFFEYVMTSIVINIKIKRKKSNVFLFIDFTTFL